jgi:hypothetical protein
LMAPPGTSFPSLDFHLSLAFKFWWVSPPSRFLSHCLTYWGCPTVNHGEALAGWETPSVHQLGGLTCSFLRMLRKIQVNCLMDCQLVVRTFLPSDNSVLPGRTTTEITNCFFPKNGPVYCAVSSKTFRPWVSKKSSTVTGLPQQTGHLQFPNSAWSQKLPPMLWDMVHSPSNLGLCLSLL